MRIPKLPGRELSRFRVTGGNTNHCTTEELISSARAARLWAYPMLARHCRNSRRQGISYRPCCVSRARQCKQTVRAAARDTSLPQVFYGAAGQRCRGLPLCRHRRARRIGGPRPQLTSHYEVLPPWPRAAPPCPWLRAKVFLSCRRAGPPWHQPFAPRIRPMRGGPRASPSFPLLRRGSFPLPFVAGPPSVFRLRKPPIHKTSPVGFEPTQGDPIGLAGRRLSHSAKVS